MASINPLIVSLVLAMVNSKEEPIPVKGKILCDFEKFDSNPCVIQDKTDVFDWKLGQGVSSDLDTGPQKAFSGDYYFYIDASIQEQGDYARFTLKEMPKSSASAKKSDEDKHIYVEMVSNKEENREDLEKSESFSIEAAKKEIEKFKNVTDTIQQQNPDTKARENTTRNPIVNSTASPKPNTTLKPKIKTTEKPITATTKKPNIDTTKKPITSTTKKPKTSTTNQPKTSTTKKPNTGSTEKIKPNIPKIPKTNTTQKLTPSTTNKQMQASLQDQIHDLLNKFIILEKPEIEISKVDKEKGKNGSEVKKANVSAQVYDENSQQSFEKSNETVEKLNIEKRDVPNTRTMQSQNTTKGQKQNSLKQTFQGQINLLNKLMSKSTSKMKEMLTGKRVASTKPEEEVQSDADSGFICVTLMFFMYGKNVGSFTIYDKGPAGMIKVFELRGDHGSAWIPITVRVREKHGHQIVFEGKVGNGALGNIAVDDISLTLC